MLQGTPAQSALLLRALRGALGIKNSLLRTQRPQQTASPPGLGTRIAPVSSEERFGQCKNTQHAWEALQQHCAAPSSTAPSSKTTADPSAVLKGSTLCSLTKMRKTLASEHTALICTTPRKSDFHFSTAFCFLKRQMRTEALLLLFTNSTDSSHRSTQNYFYLVARQRKRHPVPLRNAELPSNDLQALWKTQHSQSWPNTASFLKLFAQGINCCFFDFTLG